MPSIWSAQRWRRLHWWAAAVLLAVSAGLAISSLVRDSITFDETNHVAAGLSYLATGDLRMSPETPPLARIWAALPILFMDYRLPAPETCGWQEGDVWQWGKCLLCAFNDGDRLVFAARCQVVLLLLATEIVIYVCARLLGGPGAGLLALAIAAFCPTLLAHGRLATTDLPVALLSTLTLLTFARLFQCLNAGRMIAALLCIAALSVTKFSWVLVIPALVVMAGLAVFGGRLWPLRWFSRSAELSGKFRKSLVLGCVCLAVAGAVYLGIWSCYAWRYSMFQGEGADRAGTLAVDNPAFPALANMDDVWKAALCDDRGQPLQNASTRMIAWACEKRLLPEGYLYGLAYLQRSAEVRPAYLLGETSQTGWRSYYPIAFAIKTPIGTMTLFAAGLIALLRRSELRRREPVLLIGLLTLVGVFAGAAISSPLNIGHRHLLPVYPPLIALAGGAAGWCGSRFGRWIVALSAAGVLYANLSIWPNYLSYFNEFVGGPKNGQLYLLDSNLDWGQDLKRLADYARRHPAEDIKLAYFGSVEPGLYKIDCQELPSYFGFRSPIARLTAGTYVISATQLFGVYSPMAGRSFWESRDGQALYRQTANDAAQRAPTTESEADRRRRLDKTRQYEYMRGCRLLCKLSQRTPDERIGWSLFVYRLTQAEAETMAEP